ncbi:MAG TPA: SDR family oxidoreductase [Polyangiaceae bacterium]|nr:SDR family oxidoreductase [Polyangiaceae bacterium]
MKSFVGKVAAITGAGSGIGRALALALVRSGCEVALSDIDAGALGETAELCAPFGPRVTSTLLDVADRAAVYRWADQVVGAHGRVHLIFNNAGVSLVSALESAAYEDLEWIVGINFWGVVYGTKAFLPHLRAAGEGHVINISSVFGITAVPNHGAYNATKFAVRGFTEALRIELAATRSPVSATCVFPGGVRTNIARRARVRAGVEGTTAASEEASRELFERNCRTTAEGAAAAILRGVRRDRRRVLIGVDARAIDLLVRLAPAASQHVVLAAARRTAR